MMSTIPLRLLGLFLLALAIVIPSCQAVFAHDRADPQMLSTPGVMRN